MPDDTGDKRGRKDSAPESNRRSFFRSSWMTLLHSVVEFQDALNEEPPPPPRRILRPPGAVDEQEFLDTCFRCGSCIDACPVNAIRRFPANQRPSANSPYIDPDLSACTCCSEVACTIACPSGALRQLTGPDQIRIGVAEMFYDRCERTAGKECTICIEQCPIGQSAIAVNDLGRIEVHAACTGCGMCQLHCPTRPRAIRVRPV
jgi:ferredoxin-type protein NapG